MKYFKKYAFPLIALAILIIAIASYYLVSHRPLISSTSSYIKILELGGNDREPWAMVNNPYSPKADPFKLSLDSYNTQNLLVIGNVYFALYETNLKTKESVLDSIKQAAEPKEP